MSYKFSLQKYNGKNSRYTCPNCGQPHEFSRYIDNDTGEHIADHVGKCNRENNCGYHYPPRQYFADNNIQHTNTKSIRMEQKNVNEEQNTSKEITYLPGNFRTRSVNKCNQSALFKFFEKRFGKEKALAVFQKYNVGINKDRNTLFWQVDIKGRTRHCKAIVFNAETGKRSDVYFAGNDIAKVFDNKVEPNLIPCIFGENLLRDNILPVCIVESEKTAMVASILFPEYIWIATGGSHGCHINDPEINKIFIGRKIILFPDLGAFEKWSKFAQEMCEQGLNVSVSTILEDNATAAQRTEGLDIADYILDQATLPNIEIINSSVSISVNTNDSYDVFISGKIKKHSDGFTEAVKNNNPRLGDMEFKRIKCYLYMRDVHVKKDKKANKVAS